MVHRFTPGLARLVNQNPELTAQKKTKKNAYVLDKNCSFRDNRQVGFGFKKRDGLKNLYTASNQWATRPNDERFKTLGSLLTYAKKKRSVARQSTMNFQGFGIDVDGSDVVMTKGSKTIGFTNWSFTQFCARVGAPPKFLSDLPAHLAVDILQYRLKKMEVDGRESQVLFNYVDGKYTVRAFNGSTYSRVWDYQVVENLLNLTAKGWDVPPAYDASTFGGEVTTGHSGLYCGDRDCFIFMVNTKNRIDDGSDEGLGRGFFIGNSEVGAAAWARTDFLYKYICGNHIVWGAQNVSRVAIRHVGEADQKVMASMATQLKEYADQSPKPLEDAIRKAKAFELGKSDEEVEDLIFKLRILPRKVVRRSIEVASEYEDILGATPWSAWGLSQGITRVSQEEQFADRRVQIDQATEKVLKLVN